MEIEQKSERESYQHVCPPRLPGNRVRPCLLCFPRDRNPPRNINNVLLSAKSERGGWGGGGEDGLKFTKQLFVKYTLLFPPFCVCGQVTITQNGDDYGWTLSEQLYKLL